MVIRTKCNKCSVTIRLDFGSLSKEEAIDVGQRMDGTPRECPGRHVELSGWWTLYGLEDAIHRAYDLGEGEEPEPVMTDKEYVEKLLGEGKDILDGGCNTVPEFNLPSIHDFRDLEHVGFGNFKSAAHLFLRLDSPRSTRYYERVPLKSVQPATLSA
ncbi:MAG: hypothetical protein HUU46_07555 [Candidatus Hydrogenedentes bacterium]|nr:hypothetical protein [Candidatus Hydrogenedentota bacterium]